VDIPAWIAAVGTVGAFGTGMVLFFLQWRDRIMDQAHAVSAWITPEGFHDDGPNHDPVRWSTLRILNKSSRPIYRVTVNWSDPDDLPSTRSYDVIPPGDLFVKLYPDSERSYLVSMTFCDSAGRKWERKEDGSVHKRSSRL
jgi:hypothetical protein